jgi:two-component system, LytTR family, sensor kinase
MPRARLIAILSSVALVAFAIRAAAFSQAFASVGSAPNWSQLITMEAANWISWSAWAGLLVAGWHRFMPNRSGGVAALIPLAGLAPALIVPMLVGTIHRVAFGPSSTLRDSYVHVLTHNLPLNILLGVTMASVVFGYLGLERTRRLELTAERLNAELTLAQLETLRSQLNPHFLFNALNGITVLARRGQTSEVEAMIGHLSALLRHSLDSARAQHVPLRVEIEALGHYLDIEHIRHRDRLTVTVDVPTAMHSEMVPSFLLQPLVENAIRHGGDDPRRPLTVVVSARMDGERMVLSVRDDGIGLPRNEPPNDGVGLGHTRARLAGLYAGAASLALGPGIDGRGTAVEIAIPVARAT